MASTDAAGRQVPPGGVGQLPGTRRFTSAEHTALKCIRGAENEIQSNLMAKTSAQGGTDLALILALPLTSLSGSSVEWDKHISHILGTIIYSFLWPTY